MTMPAEDQASFLGIDCSLTGRRWLPRPVDDRVAAALAQRLAVPEIVGRVLAGRQVELDQAEAFLAPRLRDHLPDPAHLRDMEVAVDRLIRAVTAGEPIVIFGDYDVDGASSAALLLRFFAAVGASARVYIPDRIEEGYGPNTAALLRLRSEGASVVITVDCGTTAFEPLAAAADAGLDVIVVDHHVGEPNRPAALAVVNPNRIDETSAFGHLAACGVTFLLVVALNRGLREAGWYGRSGRSEPDLLQWLDLVALGTVCDVVPLTGLNRALVAQGLIIAARRGNLGLAALADIAGLRERPDPYHLGFMLGPRINAGGRVGQADLGARLLATEDMAEALQIARMLDGHNAERRALEAGVLEDAVAQAKAAVERGAPVILVAGEGWHPGVIGIVASRLTERFNRPACVVAVEQGIGKGSARSVAGIALGSAIIAARQAGLLLSGGGHGMAAGFSVAADRLADLEDFLADRIRGQIDAVGAVRALSVDGALAPTAATAELVRMLDRIGPYGAGNEKPHFAIPAARILRADLVGEQHVRCILGGAGGGRLKAIAFRSLEKPLGRALLNAAGAPLHVVGCLRADTWNGADGVQLIIEDAAPCAASG